MANYTVKDDGSGKTITFQWNDPNPPTDSDLQEIFAQASQGAEAMSQSKKGWGEVMGESLGNVPQSALEYGKAIISPITHPVQTAKGVGQLAYENQPAVSIANAIKKLIGTSESPLGEAQQAVIGNYKSRYGGMENIKGTIAKDPVGVLGDLSTLISGAGGVANAARMGKTANVLSKIGSIMEPANVAMIPAKAALKGVTKIPAISPERLYMSAVKPGFSKKKGLAKITEEAKAGLESGITPNAAGLERLHGIIGEIDATVSNAAKEASAGGKTFKTSQALEPVLEVIEKAKNLEYSPYPKESLDIISDTVSKFINEYGDEVDVLTGLKAKKAFYKQNRPKYGKQSGVVPDEAVITEKAIARGLKDAVYDSLLDKYPELRALGKKEGALLGLEGAIEQGAQRITRRDIFGIGLPIKAGVGTLVGKATGVPTLGTIVGVAAGIIDTPSVKSRLAIAMNKAKDLKLVNEKMTRARQASRVIGSAGQQIQEQQEQPEKKRNFIQDVLRRTGTVRP